MGCSEQAEREQIVRRGSRSRSRSSRRGSVADSSAGRQSDAGRHADALEEEVQQQQEDELQTKDLKKVDETKNAEMTQESGEEDEKEERGEDEAKAVHEDEAGPQPVIASGATQPCDAAFERSRAPVVVLPPPFIPRSGMPPPRLPAMPKMPKMPGLRPSGCHMPPPPRLPALPGTVPEETRVIIMVPLKLKVTGTQSLAELREFLREREILAQGKFYTKGNPSAQKDSALIRDLEDNRLILSPEHRLEPWQLGLAHRHQLIRSQEGPAAIAAMHPFYKTKPCKLWHQDGRCHRGMHCLYAHGSMEMRKRPPGPMFPGARPGMGVAPRPTPKSQPPALEVVFTVDAEEERRRAERAKRFAIRPASFERQEEEQQAVQGSSAAAASTESSAAETTAASLSAAPRSQAEEEEEEEDAGDGDDDDGEDDADAEANEAELLAGFDNYIHAYLENMNEQLFSPLVPEDGDAGGDGEKDIREEDVDGQPMELETDAPPTDPDAMRMDASLRGQGVDASTIDKD